jgi:hypothetical protein
VDSTKKLAIDLTSMVLLGNALSRKVRLQNKTTLRSSPQNVNMFALILADATPKPKVSPSPLKAETGPGRSPNP